MIGSSSSSGTGLEASATSFSRSHRPARFTRSDIEALATLAQLELDEQEIDLFTRQLGDILGYVAQIQSIDTKDIPPTTHSIPMTNVWREDQADQTRFGDNSRILKTAPETEGSLATMI